MPLIAPAAAAAAANAVTALCPFTNLHSASPGSTGASELASARQPTSWVTATAGAPTPANSAALSYPLAANTTATHVGGFTAVSAGSYSIGFPMSPSISTGASAGSVTVAAGALTLPAS